MNLKNWPVLSRMKLASFLHFEHLYLVVSRRTPRKSNISFGVRVLCLSRTCLLKSCQCWHAMASGEPQHTADWDTEERFPQFKEWAQKMGLGSAVRVPLTTPHRRLGVYGISRDTVNPFSEEEISFLGLIGRVVAFALDDGLNLSARATSK